jgi:hypothetical protein
MSSAVLRMILGLADAYQRRDAVGFMNCLVLTPADAGWREVKDELQNVSAMLMCALSYGN